MRHLMPGIAAAGSGCHGYTSKGQPRVAGPVGGMDWTPTLTRWKRVAKIYWTKKPRTPKIPSPDPRSVLRLGMSRPLLN